MQKWTSAVNESLGMVNHTKGTCGIIDSCTRVVFDPTSSTVATEWGLICDKTWVLSFIISLQMVGGIVGGLIAGQVSSTFGRKFGLYSSLVLCGVTNLLAVFSPNWQIFAAIRFFMGVGFGGIIAVGLAFPFEYVNDKWRAFVTGIPAWAMGMLTFAVLAWILRDWKQIHIATFVLSVICFLPIIWLPDSIRWMALHGKVDAAKKVAEKIAKTNSKPKPNTDFIDDLAAREHESIKHKSNYTYVQILDKTLRARTIILVVLWAVISIAYYCILFGITALSGNFYVNLMLLATVPGPLIMLITPVLVNTRLGRKWSLIGSLLLVSLLCFLVGVVYFTTSGNSRVMTITAIALTIKSLLGLNWTISNVHLVELFPTVVRSQACAAALIGARAGTVIAPFLIPRNFDTLYISYAAMGGLILLCGAMVLVLPETKGKSLEEMLQVEEAGHVQRKPLTQDSDHHMNGSGNAV